MTESYNEVMMKELILNGKHNRSKILIGRNLMKQAAEHFRKLFEGGRTPSAVCVITDSNVAKLYLQQVEEELLRLDLPVFHYIIPAGEESKNLNTISQIYDTLSNRQFGRNDMIVALGGGVTGDIAGFAAATYLRGVRHLVQIPTTLLAQVDSSVGGKTGVDLPQGKNLVGAFRQPDLVLIDPAVLESLPEDVFISGMAEVIKYGCIWDEDILKIAEQMDCGGGQNRTNELGALIERCVDIKIKVVEEDETEEGLRRILNFGHTVAHGVEKLGNYTELSHGEAVAIGMAAAVKMGENAGITPRGSYERLTAVLQRYGLSISLTYPVEAVYEALLTDKKKQGNSIHFVFIEAFGKTQVRKIPVGELKQMMKALGD